MIAWLIGTTNSQVNVNFINSSKRRGGFFALALLISSLSFAGTALAQEALRLSIEGDVAAMRRQQETETIGYYNLLLGPTAWRFSSGMLMQYDDNVNLTTPAEGDFILTPYVDTKLNWPITAQNTLGFSLSAGYSVYAKHQNLDQFFVNPGSGTSFDVYIGDFTFDFHDRLSLSENFYENAGTSGNNAYELLENVAGVTGMWNLNKAEVTLGYDHADYISLNSSSDEVLPNTSSENFYMDGGIRVVPEVLAGLEAGGSIINYDQSSPAAIPNASQWNTGAFVSTRISQFLTARLDAGYTMYLPDMTATNYSSGSASGVYLQFLISHLVNKYINYSLSAGRSVDLSDNLQPYSREFVRAQPNWNLFEQFQISTPFWWEHGTEIYNSGATFDQYGIGIKIRRNITKKLTGELSDQFVKEVSELSDLNYTVNIVSLNFSYRF